MSHGSELDRIAEIDKEAVVPRAFISHTGQDENLPNLSPAFFAYKLRDYLVQRVETFYDADIEKGDDYRDAIRKAARTCQVMVIVLSPTYPLRYWCMLELDLAMKAKDGGANITIIPVYYSISSGDELAVTEEWKAKWTEMHAAGKKGVDVERWERNLVALERLQGFYLKQFTGKKAQLELEKSVGRKVFELLPSTGQSRELQRLPVPSLQPMRGYIEDLRPGLLQELKAFVLGQEGSSKAISCVHGEGGLGKTVLARALAVHQDVRNRFWPHIHWVSLGQDPDVLDLQAKLLHDLEPSRGEVSLENWDQGREAIRRELRFLREPCLIVLDDVWTRDAVTSFACEPEGLPENVRVLVTTRSEGIAYSLTSEALMLRGLTSAQSLKLIAAVTKTSVEDLKQGPVDAVIEQLGGNTLGVQLASRLVAKSRVINWGNILVKMRELLEGNLIIQRDPDLSEHHMSMFACLRLSLDDLRQSSEEAERDCLRTGALVANAKVPLDVLCSLWGCADELDAQLQIEELAGRHLVLPYVDDDGSVIGLSLHSLQSAFYVHELQLGEGLAAVQEALLGTLRDKCRVGTSDTSWIITALEGTYMGQHLPHHLLGILKYDGGVSDEWLAVADEVLARMVYKGRYFGSVEGMARQTLAVKEKALGVDHPEYATTLSNLAKLLVAQGKYEAAEPLYRSALAVQEEALGVDHPSYATTLHSLAGLLKAQGKYEAAEPLYRSALAVQEKALGVDHPEYATTLHNLANLLKAQGKYEAAEPLYERKKFKSTKHTSERGPLMDLFFATRGREWSERAGWGTDEPLENWYGLTLEEGHVTELRLKGNNLQGSIPATIGLLTKLKLLQLNENNLSGDISDHHALWSLADLESLWLGGEHHQLRGPQDPEVLSSLTKLRHPPAIYVKQGWGGMNQWWQAVQRSGATASKQLKVVLTGVAYAGKTSLYNHLARPPQENALVPHSERTKLADIENKDICLKDVDLRVWDFGGQDEYYPYHQLFLSSGALHVLVVDLGRFGEAQKEGGDHKAEVDWWLDALHARVEKGVVLVVGSKADRLSKEGNEQGTAPFKDVGNLASIKDGLNDLMKHIKGYQSQRGEAGGGNQIVVADTVAFSAKWRMCWCLREGRDQLSEIKLADELERVAHEYGAGKDGKGLLPSVDAVIPRSWQAAVNVLMGLRSEVSHGKLLSEAIEGYKRDSPEDLRDLLDDVTIPPEEAWWSQWLGATADREDEMDITDDSAVGREEETRLQQAAAAAEASDPDRTGNLPLPAKSVQDKGAPPASVSATAQLQGSTSGENNTPLPSARGVQRSWIPLADARQKWQEVRVAARRRGVLRGAVEADLMHTVHLQQQQGAMLLTGGDSWDFTRKASQKVTEEGSQESTALLHLNPTWLTQLLKPIADHELNSFTSLDRLKKCKPLGEVKGTDQLPRYVNKLCSSGLLEEDLLRFLWSQGSLPQDVRVEENDMDKLIDTLVETRVLLPSRGRGKLGRQWLVPFRLPSFIEQEALPPPIRDSPHPSLIDREVRDAHYSTIEHEAWPLHSLSYSLSFAPAGCIALFTSRCSLHKWTCGSSEIYHRNINSDNGDVDISKKCIWRDGVCFRFSDGSSRLFALVYLVRSAGGPRVEIRIQRQDADYTKQVANELVAVLKDMISADFPGVSMREVAAGPDMDVPWNSIDPDRDTLAELMKKGKNALAHLSKAVKDSLNPDALFMLVDEKFEVPAGASLLQRRLWQGFAGIGAGGLLNKKVKVLSFSADTFTYEETHQECISVTAGFVKTHNRILRFTWGVLAVATLCINAPVASSRFGLPDASSVLTSMDDSVRELMLSQWPVREGAGLMATLNDTRESGELGRLKWPLCVAQQEVLGDVEELISIILADNDGKLRDLDMTGSIPSSLTDMVEDHTTGTEELLVKGILMGGMMKKSERHWVDVEAPEGALVQSVEATLRIHPALDLFGQILPDGAILMPPVIEMSTARPLKEVLFPGEALKMHFGVNAREEAWVYYKEDITSKKPWQRLEYCKVEERPGRESVDGGNLWCTAKVHHLSVMVLGISFDLATVPSLGPRPVERFAAAKEFNLDSYECKLNSYKWNYAAVGNLTKRPMYAVLVPAEPGSGVHLYKDLPEFGARDKALDLARQPNHTTGCSIDFPRAHVSYKSLPKKKKVYRIGFYTIEQEENKDRKMVRLWQWDRVAPGDVYAINEPVFTLDDGNMPAPRMLEVRGGAVAVARDMMEACLGLSPPGPAPSPPGRRKDRYDVFLSHAGAIPSGGGMPDKETICATLKKGLEELAPGIQVFLDRESLKLGCSASEAMETAARTCAVGIVVLSPEYMESEWCIRELEIFLGRQQTGPPGEIRVGHLFWRLTFSKFKEMTRDSGEAKSALLSRIYGGLLSWIYGSEDHTAGQEQGKVKDLLSKLADNTGIEHRDRVSIDEHAGEVAEHIVDAVNDVRQNTGLPELMKSARVSKNKEV
ncbi:unnamed protein product [Chrysoparadoxa australica]